MLVVAAPRRHLRLAKSDSRLTEFTALVRLVLASRVNAVVPTRNLGVFYVALSGV